MGNKRWQFWKKREKRKKSKNGIDAKPFWLSKPDLVVSKFDVAYYMSQAKDVAEIDALQHYYEIGAATGLNPAPWFDTAFYLKAYPDVAAAGVNPFEHFVCYGMSEGRLPLELDGFVISGVYIEAFGKLVGEDHAAQTLVRDIRRFSKSDRFKTLLQKAAALEPDIGGMISSQNSILPPWHDPEYDSLKKIRALIPAGKYDSIILMPAGRMGGADLVAAILARALNTHERVLILRTDAKHWDCPGWYPEETTSVDISQITQMQNDRRALYTLLYAIRPKRIFNVNSRLAFETFLTFGKQLAAHFDLYAYYFCADRTEDNVETGYPVWYFSNLLPHLEAALFDTQSLAQALTERFAIPASQISKVKTIYTPAQNSVTDITVAQRQKTRAQAAIVRRPCILWAGRLDRQKRFDFVIEVARVMPDVDFRCWGKAVLDKPPDLDTLPSNIEVNPPFAAYNDLPLSDCDGWFYTAAWDGLPTILIELGAIGMPIAATSVGGVPELVDETTGWTIDGDASPEDAAAVLRAMISDPEARVTRAAALQERVRDQHNMDAYTRFIYSI